MGQYDDDPLCCCEYINERQERSHIIATCCNCEALDLAFDRLIHLQKMDPGNIDQMIVTIGDRLRFPWAGGAKKIPGEIVLVISFLLIVFFLGSISTVFAFISYLLILPTFLYSVHRYLRSKYKKYAANRRFSAHDAAPRSKFYFFWLISSISLLIIIYYTTVITTLKISAWENLLFLFFTLTSTTSLFLVKATACKGFQYREGSEDVIESGAWKICGDCQHQVPRQASHCRACNTCVLLRDHHCMWLDTCISSVNDRWFLVGLGSGLCALLYGCYLIFTTVCHCRLIQLHYFTLLYPSQCNDAYFNLMTSLATSAGSYCLILCACTLMILIQQLVCIASGVKLREYKARKQLPGGIVLSFSKMTLNCVEFWYRKNL